VTARFQHATLAYNPGRGPLSPDQLAGKRVGMRSYSVTTAAWVRGILADDHGVDLGQVNWVTLEEPHVAEFRDPPNATRMPPGKDLQAMLLAASSTPRSSPSRRKDGPLRTLIPDPRPPRRLAGEARRDPDQPHGDGRRDGLGLAGPGDLLDCSDESRGGRQPGDEPVRASRRTGATSRSRSTACSARE
jgi:hypothetical protein